HQQKGMISLSPPTICNSAAPWEDTNGDLIVTGYVYTEIEPRRWVIGDGTPQSEPVLRPLQTVQHEPKSETTK
ncbi:TraV family lipoprotein, partial [Klebsiella pneumoniae]|uniref:TraV family lipoprotein n=1 Tax=Klebsiella pneumoniae TaxID=573 RepID=UPI00165FB01D